MFLRKIKFIVTPELGGKTVLTVLTLSGTSKRLITKLKQAENGITKNGIHTRTIDTVQTGDVIEISLSDEKVLEENAELNVPVIYEDNDVIVFDKPDFMPVHPSHKHLYDTLGNYFAYCCKGLTYRPINRLDRDTSGLCAVAKNSFSAVNLQKSIEKVYYAVAGGKITGSGTIDKPIARTDNSIITRCVSEDGQKAVTHYEVLRSNDKYTLLKIKLETGRTHQIRVHFSYIGHPLAGDNMYGGDMTDLNRQALHCGELFFTHPVTQEKIHLISKLPQDIECLFSE